MSNELIRFRAEPELRDKAAKVCGELGFELNDVLRALVTRIARDGALPFSIDAPPSTPQKSRPFYEYDEQLWSSLKPSVDAEVALALLARFIANCSTAIDEGSQTDRPDIRMMESLRQQRGEARSLKENLDVQDAAAVRQVLDRFGPLVRTSAH